MGTTLQKRHKGIKQTNAVDCVVVIRTVEKQLFANSKHTSTEAHIVLNKPVLTVKQTQATYVIEP